ncbi:hypothetical protein FA13DRAFT_706484 [Coprinellus micaceus]|uniref:BTB domain-containing protein n=1 Tax=Coprinellus micaceus TaxID=71717 RepID=A0A4Y7TU67_COPMI|nr:hypothetical protein FA13DRAFT_706484 [Coprinellus micaceus]
MVKLKLRYSVKDCRIPVDVVLRSRDKILIGAHQANLSGYSEGFPDADAISDASEPVDLTENAETLRILMYFVHKLQYPNVSLLKGDALFDLAVAAEKYMVLSAMSTCSLCIQFTVAKDPIRSLRYAVKHGYRDIADVAAPLTMYKSMETMKSGLGHDGALFAWDGLHIEAKRDTRRGKAVARIFKFELPFMPSLEGVQMRRGFSCAQVLRGVRWEGVCGFIREAL